VGKGNTVMLICIAYGAPNVNVTWNKGGEEISNTTRMAVYSTRLEEGGVPFMQATFEICGVELKDAGMYSCQSSNQNVSDTSSLTLTVQAPRG